MAEGQGIKRVIYWHGIFWTGEAAHLVAAGLWPPDLLPGTPGHNKWSITLKGAAGRKKWIVRNGRQFRVYWSNEALLAHAGDAFRAFMTRTLEPVPLES